MLRKGSYVQGAGDSEHEVYGRLYGTVDQLPPWTGRGGAYTPFECVEFGDTEILHDLEVTVRLHKQRCFALLASVNSKYTFWQC